MKVIDKIIIVLRKAAAIKDVINPLCGKHLIYYGRTMGYSLCIKCYPDQKDLDKKCFKRCDFCCEYPFQIACTNCPRHCKPSIVKPCMNRCDKRCDKHCKK